MKTHTFFSKKLVTFISMLMCLIMAFSAVACGGKDDDGLSDDMVQITLQGSTDGYGVRALRLQAARFNKAFENKVYTDEETGKVYTGAQLEITEARSSASPTSAWLTDTNTMYNTALDSTSSSAVQAYDNGYIANIDYILRKTIPGEDKSIYDKIAEGKRYLYGGTVAGSTNENQFDLLGMPFNVTYNGFSYDIDLFDTGYYVAHPGAEEVSDTYVSSIIEDFSVDFVDKDGEKSVGPNGISGDYDDGLPSSLYEFIVLCEKLKNAGIAPIGYAGSAAGGDIRWYLSLGLNSLLFSLLGYENGKSFVEFEADSLNVVTGFEGENLFSDAMSSDINVKKPIVTQIEMEEANGYYHTWTLENYMVLAFADLINSQDWGSYSSKYSRTHIETQRDFIFGIEPAEAQRQFAMLSEGSYWYNESVDALNFTQYEMDYLKTADERNISWMPMPVNIYTSVTGVEGSVTVNGVTESTKGESVTLDEATGGAIFVNKNVEDNEVIMEAVEDYLLFISSNDELNKFVIDSGYSKGLEFKYDEEIMADAPKYIQRTFSIYNSANAVGTYSSKRTYRERPGFTFARNQGSDYVTPREATNYTQGPVGFIINYDGAVGCFKNNMYSRDDWFTLYKGQGENDNVTYAVYPAGHPKAGQNVVFED